MFSAQCNNQTWPEVKQIKRPTGWSHWTQTFSYSGCNTQRIPLQFWGNGIRRVNLEIKLMHIIWLFFEISFSSLKAAFTAFEDSCFDSWPVQCRWTKLLLTDGVGQYVIGVFKPGTLLKLGLWVLKMQTWVLGFCFVCLGFNSTFSTNRLYRAITVG